MSLTLERPGLAGNGVEDLRERRLRERRSSRSDQVLEIGLVNNMPDSAVAATERQFIRLLQEASGEYDVRLRLYALDSTVRHPDMRAQMAATYHRARDLGGVRLDALIVTGAEPRAPSLVDEAYWRELVEVFDLARKHTESTIFSCLAAHAAVLHWDAISRKPLPRKLSGVFAGRAIYDHPLVEGFPGEILSPHSRLNSVDEADLDRKGYATLVRSDETGADIFVKDEGSLLVFLQGHLEYDADSLAREFRRDVLRYLGGDRPTPPEPPEHYFADSVMAEIGTLIGRARHDHRSQSADCFPLAALTSAIKASWRGNCQRLYSNWLKLVADRKRGILPLGLAAMNTRGRRVANVATLTPANALA